MYLNIFIINIWRSKLKSVFCTLYFTLKILYFIFEKDIFYLLEIFFLKNNLDSK